MMVSLQVGMDKRIKTLGVVAVLLLTLTCLVGLFVEDTADEKPTVVAVVTAAGGKEQPQIVGGFVPERHQGPPPPRQESFFLSWDFINGLFAIILVVEFAVFPFLFWLWFGKDKRTESK
jgi:hypothetical protein